MRWSTAVMVVTIPVVIIGVLGGRIMHRRTMRKRVAAFLQAIRSGNILVDPPESMIGSGERARMFRGQAGLSKFIFMMKTDVNGTVRHYSLVWHDIGVAVGVWNPLKADESNGLHEVYDALAKLSDQRPTVVH